MPRRTRCADAWRFVLPFSAWVSGRIDRYTKSVTCIAALRSNGPPARREEPDWRKREHPAPLFCSSYSCSLPGRIKKWFLLLLGMPRTLIKLFSRIPWQKRAVRCELLFGGFEIPSGSPSRIPLLGYQTTTASACITHDPAMRTSRLARSAFKRTKFPVGNLSF